MIIDVKRDFTPYKVKGETPSYPDHYGILLTFKEIPAKNETFSLGKKFTIWNKNKINGWEKYLRLTNSNEKFDQIAKSETNDADSIMNSIDKELNSIKYKCFGKVKIRKKANVDKIDELLAKKSDILENQSKDETEQERRIKEIDREIARELQAKQTKELQDEMEKLEGIKERKGCAAAVSNIRDSIVGKKKDVEEPCAVLDPDTNKLVFKPSEIVRVSAEYVRKLLKNRDPRDGFEEDILWKKRVHELRMKEHVVNDIEFSVDMLKKHSQN